MSLFRSKRPVICKVHGFAVAGGSDIALCCDMIVMAEDARIGYMPVRVWGCPTTAMWVYGSAPRRPSACCSPATRSTGVEAAALGLVLEGRSGRTSSTRRWTRWRTGWPTVPQNQLMMQKLMVNQALDNMGLHGHADDRDRVRRHHAAFAARG